MRFLRTDALVSVFTVLVLWLLPIPLSAQSTATVNPDLNPYGSYHGGDFESVTLPNSLLDLHIPLISFPQRGNLHLGFNVVFNNHTFGSKQVCTTTCTVYWFMSGLGLNIYPDIEYAQGSAWTQSSEGQVPNFSAITADGSAHAMGSTSSNNWFAMDGSGFQYNSSSDVLIDSKGTRYYGSNTDGTFNPTLPTKVEDTNGNLITTTLNAGTTTPPSFTDSLGRSIPLPPGPSTPGNSQTSNFTGCTGTVTTSAAYNWTLPGVNGGTTVFKLCYAGPNVTYPTSDCSPNGTPKCQAFDQSELVIQSIVLPNGTAWTFGYDGYGNLDSVTLPTGGTITYSWTIVENTNNMTAATYITSRSINANDGTGTHTWTYSSGTVTDPDGNQTLHTFGRPSCYQPGGSPYVCAYETETQYYQDVSGTQTLMKTVNTSYQYSAGSGNVLSVPISVTTTWPNGKVSQWTKTYGTTGMALTGNFSGTAILGQVTQQQDFDYGSSSAGALLRTTNTTYMAVSGSAYLTNGLLRLPSTVTILNGAGTQLASTTYAYDASALNPSGVSSSYLDPSPPNGADRGNLTSVTRWLNTPSSNLVSTKKYWDTGELNTSTTPNLNTTTYNYTCAGAYLQSVQDPLGHTTTYNPDCNTGVVLSVTDENSQMTSHQYDPSWRLTQTTYPDGGQVTECYTDTVGGSCAGSTPYEVVTTTAVSSGNMVGTEVFDGLGRLSQKQVNSDPAGTDYVDVTYDELGRKHSQSNPYRSKTDSTYGITTYAYDALGRPTVTTNPDNSTITRSYTGAATEITDEGNGTSSVSHVHQKDGLGRLVSVCEVTSATQLGSSGSPVACSQDIAANGFLTTYTYDALGNLTAATQAGLNARSFTYDSLSRLISATNPESGTITYAYDGDSNLTSRVAPAPNQTSSSVTVTTTYGYDALDRLTSKTYSDGTTPNVAMTYDVEPSSAPASLTNTVGRLLEASVSNAITWESYDKMGRPAEEWQCTPANCGSGTFALPYTYGPAGEMLTFTNGAGVTFTNQYDTALQLTSLGSSQSDANHPGTLLSGLQYNALGGMSSANMGNGTTESITYTNRGWPQSMSVAGNGPGVAGAGSATASGSEQSVAGTPAVAGSGTITISGTEASATIEILSGHCTRPPCAMQKETIFDSGTISVTVDGFSASASWGQGSTSSSIASALASSLTSSSSPVKASASGSVVTITSVATGSSSDYSLSASATDTSGGAFSASFSAAASGSALTGGANAGATTYDSGSAWVTVNGVQSSVSYGQGSTASSVASALASAINASSASVTASASGTTISLVANSLGPGTNYSLSAGSSTSQSSTFSSPSFSIAVSGSALTGGQGAGAGTIYSYNLGYAPDGDITSAADTANGSWTYGYDSFNRLAQATEAAPSQAFTYAYDPYGNRGQDYLSGACQAGTTSCLSFDANNHVTGGVLTYDAAGNVTVDNLHHYTYDAENRIICVDGANTASCTTNTSTAAVYVYDAFGQRVQKTTSAGAVEYFYDLAGHEVTEINSSEAWTRTEIYAGGKHLATYSGGASGTTSFIHADWLGTERIRSNTTASVAETCTSLPFGDGQSCTGTDVSPMHFTGKQRDTESNLDDFGARYYSSSLARWVTPDWSARQEAVPYADLQNPQSLNLYAYVGNNPTTATDATGHARGVMGGQNNGCWFQGDNSDCDGAAPSTTSNDQSSPSTNSPDQTAPAQNNNPLSSITVLGNKVGITYGSGLTDAQRLAASDAIAASAGLLNKNAGKLSADEKKAIGEITSFAVSGPNALLGATGKGSMTLSIGYIHDSSAAWLGSLFGHEGQHYLNSGKYSGSNMWRDEQSAGRTQLGIGNKIGFSSSERQYLEQWIDDRNRAAMQQHMEQGYSY